MTVPILMAGKRPVINWSLLGSLPSGLTFTRASSGTYFDADGVLQSATNNVPRFDHDPVTHALRGLLVEGQRTNKITNAIIDAYNTGWNAVNINRGGTILAPDGTNTWRWIDDGTGAGWHSNLAAYAAFTAGDVLTCSVFLKAGTAFIAQIGGTGIFPAGTRANFNLSTGVVTLAQNCTASMDNVGWGYYRCVFTATCTTSTASGRTCNVTLVNNDPNAAALASYTGTGLGLYMWGAQSELSATASSYIPTTGAAATRAADQVSFVVPSGVSVLRVVFYDNTYQDLAVSAGAYTLPTPLNRSCISRIYSLN